jgi:flagellar hook-basal body complex protein FliE
MDPVSTAIITALNVGISEVVKDAYTSLKGALQKKFGGNSDIVEAVKVLENKPDSTLFQGTLQKAIEITKAQEDDELKQLAKVLLKKLEEIPESQKVVSKYNITGAVGVAGDNAHVEGGIHFKS